MAQVEHAYQYSVEVRSRFSLLLEDNKSKVKSERPSEPPESHKRKPVPIIVPTPAPPITPATAVDEEPAPESPSEELVEKSPKKTEAVAPFALSRRGGPQRISTRANLPDEEQVADSQQVPRFSRGRGFRSSRPFYGDRGRIRPYNNDSGDAQIDTDIREDGGLASEEKDRLRFRGRGFGRGRPRIYGDHRDFDRHSGSDKTGIKPVIKREGFGQGNWGTVQDVLDVTLEPPPEDDASHVVNDENQIPEEKTEEKEEPPKTLTLDEYKAMQRANKPAIALSAKSSRKPNDGKDVFKNMVAHQKIVKDNEDSDAETSETPGKVADNLSFIDFTYADRMNRGRGRDGLGRSRGQGFSGGRGESRGFPREERGSRGARATRIRGSREFTRGSVPQPSRSVKVDYDEEFPTLG